jgi:ABC-type Fe3+/spermidine/putrescine transport system ATPase subunit
VDGEIARVRLTSGEVCPVDAGLLTTGAAVELSIRPEAVELVPIADGADRPAASGGTDPDLAGRVVQTAYLGTSVTYVVRTEGGLPIAAVVPRSMGRLPADTAVIVRWRRGDALVLVPGTHVAEEEAS